MQPADLGADDLVADGIEQAREQWVKVFARDRADLTIFNYGSY